MATMTDLGAPLFIDVEGLRIRHVRSPGDATKTPVLMVSPFPESLYAYDDVWADISQVAPLVALDVPGSCLTGSTTAIKPSGHWTRTLEGNECEHRAG
jgi:pimeloyl-ACP methyl ester carboxylesterase